MEELDRIWYLIIDVIDPIVGAILFALAIIGGIGARIYFTRRAKPKKNVDSPVYVREAPEGWTAGEMCPLFYYFDKKKVYIDESISATILDLARKGYIEITDDDPDDDLMARIRIVTTDKKGLKTHEGIILTLLENVGENREWFQMEEFEKYLKNNEDYVVSQIEAYREACEKKSKDEGCYRDKDKVKSRVEKIAVVLILVGIGAFFVDYAYLEWGLFMLTEIGLFVLGIALSIGSAVSVRLSDKGEKLYFEFHALEAFLKDFSALDEHDIPSLALWDEYMVYATAMGIAESVSKNMEVKYPTALSEEEKSSSSAAREIYRGSVGFAAAHPFFTYAVVKDVNRSMRRISRGLARTALNHTQGGAGFMGMAGRNSSVSSVLKSVNRGIRPGGGRPPWRR